MIFFRSRPVWKPPAGVVIDRGNPLGKDVLSWWLMNEGGGVTLFDIAGGLNNGSLTSNPVWSSGKFGPALKFDGSASFVNVPDADNLTFALVPFSISFWFNTTSSATSGWMGKYVTGALEYNIGNNVNGINFNIYDNTAATYIGRNGPLPSLNIWHHLCCTYDGGTAEAGIKMYLDGTRFDTGSFSGAAGFVSMRNTTAALTIGKSPAFIATTYSGFFDDIRIYKRALTQTQAQMIYQGFRPIVWRRVPVNKLAAAGGTLLRHPGMTGNMQELTGNIRA